MKKKTKIDFNEGVTDMMLKKPSSMLNKEIKNLIQWAESEISEYQDFIDKLNKELLKRTKR